MQAMVALDMRNEVAQVPDGHWHLLMEVFMWDAELPRYAAGLSAWCVAELIAIGHGIKLFDPQFRPDRRAGHATAGWAMEPPARFLRPRGG